MTTLTAFCLPWHMSQSAAFAEVLAAPLKPWAEVTFQAWDGRNVPPPRAGSQAVVFCQSWPPGDWLPPAGARVVWIPMWDGVCDRPGPWWRRFPRTLRVVAFSDAVARRAESAGLPTLRLRYHADPDALPPARWDRGRVLHYWNRTGLAGPEFLRRLCEALRIEKLIFQNRVDPGAPPEANYLLAPRLGTTAVVELKGIMPREEYLREIGEANIHLAPRLQEGVGLSFLEALARGCAVLAVDRPTMNEYMVHGKTGLLLRPGSRSRLRRAAEAMGLREPPMHPLTEDQDWSALAATDLESLGRAAREAQVAGHAAWKRQIPAYARFVLGENVA